MAQPQLLQIKLSRFDAQPWGFRLQGGTDFAAPLLVQKRINKICFAITPKAQNVYYNSSFLITTKVALQ
ncbi:PDZ and LIM domain protein Zasp [Lucilia cuprina]|nr:PDZ and LIM domain protein Zasp [Lucilia cuprina]